MFAFFSSADSSQSNPEKKPGTSTKNSNQSKTLRSFTQDELDATRHNHRECLVAISGKVFDVSRYSHPGGARSILMRPGEDVTDIFPSPEHPFGPEVAVRLLEAANCKQVGILLSNEHTPSEVENGDARRRMDCSL